MYTGEQYDSNSDLYYLRARYYDPKIGRFLTGDSYPGIEWGPASRNKYVYAESNPVGNIDPSGHFSLPEISITTMIRGILAAIEIVDAYKTYRQARLARDISQLYSHYISSLLPLAKNEIPDRQEHVYMGYREAFGGNIARFTIPPGKYVTHCYFAFMTNEEMSKPREEWNPKAWQFRTEGVQPDRYIDSQPKPDKLHPITRCYDLDHPVTPVYNISEIKDCVYRETGLSIYDPEWQHWYPWKNCCHWTAMVLRDCGLRWPSVDIPQSYPNWLNNEYPNKDIWLGKLGIPLINADPGPTCN